MWGIRKLGRGQDDLTALLPQVSAVVGMFLFFPVLGVPLVTRIFIVASVTV
jgi:hypothetical protein